MGLTDLVQQIIPTKVEVRVLKSLSGKVISNDSKYELKLKPEEVTGGEKKENKKAKLVYKYRLELVDDEEKMKIRNEKLKAEEDKKRANWFYLNFTDFSIMKLKACVFFLHFPICYTVSIIGVWLKAMPNPSLPKTNGELYSREEAEEIMSIKSSVKELVHTVMAHLKSLYDYLQGVIQANPLRTNYELIRSRPEIKEFENVFKLTKHTVIFPGQPDFHFNDVYKRIQESWNQSIDMVSKSMILKLSEI